MYTRKDYDQYTDFEPPHSVSFDGQSYDYRDPNNPDMRTTLTNSSDEDYEANPNSYNLFEDLYKFNQPEIDMAGQALGIKNINDPEEVNRMLDYLYKPKTFAEEAMDEQVEEAVSTTPLTDEFAQKGAPLSEDLQKDVDFVSKTVDEIRDGTYNDSYRRMAGGFGPAGAGATSASDALMAQMSTGSGIIDVNEFAKNRDIRDTMMEDDFYKKFDKPLFG